MNYLGFFLGQRIFDFCIKEPQGSFFMDERLPDTNLEEAMQGCACGSDRPVLGENSI